jgi:hypothetical protein
MSGAGEACCCAGPGTGWLVVVRRGLAGDRSIREQHDMTTAYRTNILEWCGTILLGRACCWCGLIGNWHSSGCRKNDLCERSSCGLAVGLAWVR